MQVYRQRISYHDIKDVEQFCVRIIHRSGLELASHEHDDLLCYLVETCWELSEIFRPGGIRFTTYAHTTLSRRTIDWVRKHRGRTSWSHPSRPNGGTYRDRVQLVSIDDQLGHTHLAGLVDLEESGCPDLERILRSRGGEPPRGNGEVGAGTDAEAA